MSKLLQRVRELGGNRSTTSLAVAAALLLLTLWWWWPTARGPLAEVDVVVVSDGFLQTAETEMDYRIHEDGFSLAWEPPVADWCAAGDMLAGITDRYTDMSAVVIAVREPGGCAADLREAVQRAVYAAGDVRVIVVAEPGWTVGDSTDGTAIDGARVVDVERLLGEPGVIERPCLTWDPCEPSGQIVVREADGVLTPAGGTRVARMVVTALR